ncbi:hypothetical protein ZIOFF_056577 [Zingiber officinale]|uniref:DUF4283 domain-containing protein n=1 Tax=Zingiber officinale TaxID=94328 RepID=A0A8J5FY53_ZINOF|nr:hypothetical protein ZIOFF_056577 [Zingiber officinale]
MSPRAAKKSLDQVGEEFKRATTYNNKPALFYMEEEVPSMSNAFHFALIGKFLGGVPMRIFKWSLKFSYEAESSVVPVWIQFPDLPIYMFCKKGLFAAANIVGRPMKVDEATTDGSRLIMARVCVEIDLLKQRLKISRLVLERTGDYKRDLKENKHLVGIPKRGEEAHRGESEILENVEENVPDLHNLDIIDRGEDLIVNQKLVHEEVGGHFSYGTKASRGKDVAGDEISKQSRSSSEEEENVGGLDISKSFVEMEDLDLDLDNLVIKKGSSSLKDESGGGADRQGQLGI